MILNAHTTERQLLMHRTVYYLPGWGGRLATGLGAAIAQRGFDIAGRETRGEFKDAGFTAQVNMVAADLQQHFWYPNAIVIANSFGGYLFLHAQSQLPAFPGRVVLLSPIVGTFDDEDKDMHFIPPYPDRLMQRIEAKQMAAPMKAEIHTGELDWQSSPKGVQRLGEALGIPVHVVTGAGHNLPKEYVGKILDRWLA